MIVPVQAEYLALEGLVQFLDTLKLVRRELNPDLTMAGVVITMQDERTRRGRTSSASSGSTCRRRSSRR